jgi:hypothetical protein
MAKEYKNPDLGVIVFEFTGESTKSIAVGTDFSSIERRAMANLIKRSTHSYPEIPKPIIPMTATKWWDKKSYKHADIDCSPSLRKRLLARKRRK